MGATFLAGNLVKCAKNLKICTLLLNMGNSTSENLFQGYNYKHFTQFSYRYDCCNIVYNSKNWKTTIVFSKIGLIKVNYAILYNEMWVKHLKQ